VTVLGSTIVQPQDESKSHSSLTVATWVAVLAAALYGHNVCVDPVWSCLVIGKLCNVHNECYHSKTGYVVICPDSLGWDQEEVQNWHCLYQR